MSHASDIESPYAPGQEFGPEVETVERDRSWYGIGVPEFAEQGRRAAKGQASASGVPGFVAPAPKPLSESALAKAVDAVEAARDRLMRSRQRLS